MKHSFLTLATLAVIPFNLQAGVPSDPMFLLSFRPGQLIEKSGYEDLDFVSIVPAKELAKVPPFVANLLKSPKESGIDLDGQVHFFATFSKELSKTKKGGEIAEPAILGGLSIPIRDAEAFQTLLTKLQDFTGEQGDAPGLKSEVKEGFTLLTVEDENGFVIGYTDKEVVLLRSNYNELYTGNKNKKKKQKLPDPGDWIREEARKLLKGGKGVKPAPALEHNSASKDDLSFFMDYSNLMEVAKSSNESKMEQELLESFLGNPALSNFMNMKIGLGLNFYPGKVELHSKYMIQEENPFADAIGDGLSQDLLNVLPNEPTLYYGASSNLRAAKQAVIDIYLPIIKKFMETDSDDPVEFGADTKLPVVDMSLGQVLDIFEGDGVLYLKDVVKTPGPIPLPQADFILGLSLNNRQLFDQLLDKLITPKKPGAQKMNIEQMLGAVGLALTRKENAVFLSHAKYAREIESGKSLNPLEPKHRKRLGSNYVNGYLNIPRLIDIIDSWVPLEEKGKAGIEYKEIMGFFKKLDTLTFTQDENLQAHMELTLADKEKNSLRAFAEFVKQTAEKRIPANQPSDVAETEEKPVPHKEKEDPKEDKKNTVLLPAPAPPLPGSTPYQIPTSKELDLNDDGYFQKYLATFRGDLTKDEEALVGRWKGNNDSSDRNEWEILQRKDRSFSLAIRSLARNQEWESSPVLHGAWRIDNGKLLYVVLQVENMHLGIQDIEINSEEVSLLDRTTLVTKGQEDSGDPFTSKQYRVERFEGPRMWHYNNPENLENFIFHIPPRTEQ
jgi:hypothetical protein